MATLVTEWLCLSIVLVQSPDSRSHTLDVWRAQQLTLLRSCWSVNTRCMRHGTTKLPFGSTPHLMVLSAEPLTMVLPSGLIAMLVAE